MAVADPVAAVRAMLLANEDLAALTSDVYGGAVPPGAEAAMPAACVVLKSSGGPASPGGGFQQYGITRIDTFCYGPTSNSAWHVYLAVYAALKQMRTQTIDGVLLQSINVLSKGALGIDPTTQWPLCLASFSVLAAEVA